MPLPAFFARVPRLRLYDPLAQLLGSADDGILDYGYEDAVKLAGHSCPTVASAYWLTWRALHALYGDALPQRGGVRVAFRDDLRDGSNGVLAAVVQLLTGAAGETGFKGLGGLHARQGLQARSPDLPMALRFTRIDNGHAVDAMADLSLLPQPPRMADLVQRCIDHQASAGELAELAGLWQSRVQRLLTEFAYDDGVFVIRPSNVAPWQVQMLVALAPPPRPPAHDRRV